MPNRIPIEDHIQFFLQQRGDELIPSTTEYKEAESQSNAARDKILNTIPEEYQKSINSALQAYDDTLTFCKLLESEYIYTIAFKEAFRTFTFLLSNTYIPLKPSDFNR